jgi:hypothetical protein
MRRPFGLRGRRRPAARAEVAQSDRPVLAVDVDGVVSLFDFAEPPSPDDAVYELIGGTMHCISTAAGGRLRRLGEHYEIVWASGWEGHTARLAGLLDLPELPFLTFGGEAEFGSADWKLRPLGEYAAGRALAWIDDSLDELCYEWARAREEPTLLLDAEPGSGLLEVHVEALIAWARSVAADRPGGGAG